MPSSEMSFWDHLDVLRSYIIRVLVVLAFVLAGCFFALPHIFDAFILGPSHADFFLYRWLGFAYGPSQDVEIININVASQFLTHISTAFWLSVVLVFPFLMYELWAFVRPALYPEEIKGVRSAFAGGTVLFYIGCAVGYMVVFPIVFRFLAQYRIGAEVANQINLGSYMHLFLSMIFVMGLVFEMPMLAWLLSALGLINKGMLRSWRRYAIVVLLVLSAAITPTGDPFTLLVVFLPLYLLYEFSILIVKSGREAASE